ncbi:uncharacterized protein Bfra_005328, partial [Botrytis fragariae]
LRLSRHFLGREKDRTKKRRVENSLSSATTISKQRSSAACEVLYQGSEGPIVYQARGPSFCMDFVALNLGKKRKQKKREREGRDVCEKVRLEEIRFKKRGVESMKRHQATSEERRAMGTSTNTSTGIEFDWIEVLNY